MSDARREARGARFDDAIDRAVREMLDVEPRADLRAKVIARIEERPASSFQLPAVSFRRFAAVATAAALLVLVLVLARRSESPVQPPMQVRGADHVLSAPAVGPKAVQAPAAAPARRPGTPTRGTVLAASFAEPEPPAADLEPLKTIAPIEVAPIAQKSIAPEPIGVRPLSPIPEMQIAPLNPPDRRN